MFKKLQLTFHLLTLYGVLAGGLLLLIGYCLFVIHSYDETIHALDREQFPLSHAVTEIARQQLDQTLRFNELLFFSRIGEREKFEMSNEKFVQAGKRLADELLEARNIAQKAMDLARSDAKWKEIDAIKTLLKGIEKAHGDYEHLGALLIRAIYQYDFLSKTEALATGDHVSAEEAAGKHAAFLQANLSALDDETHRLEGGIKDVTERVKQLPQTQAVDSAKQRDQVFQRGLLWLFFALVGGLFLVFAIDRIQKERGQREHQLTAQSLALLADALGHLQRLIQEWEPASQQLEQMMVRQGESLGKVVEEIRPLLLQAEGAAALLEQLSQLQGEERQLMEQASLLLQQVNKGADQMLESGTESGRAIHHLRDATMQINLLATNASAEAFRSEATRPFAVYTEEIKELARTNAQVAESVANRMEDALKNMRTDQIHSGQSRRRCTSILELARKEAELFARMAELLRQQPAILRTIQGVVTEAHATVQTSAPVLKQAQTARQSAQLRIKEVQDAVGGWPSGS
ncbi:MAG: methyl-accepting chemotaxis protein [Magnetococcus sp. XQGC-1]